MTGHLYIHIGPPKTATTSLQIGLERTCSPKITYLGTFQPRERNSKSHARLLHGMVSKNQSTPEAEKAVEDIRQLIQNGQTVFISEEMFLVWQKEAHFWDKLDRLEQRLNDIEHTFVVTLRKPEDVLPSYYQELYAGLPLSEKLRPSFFYRNQRCDCYDYRKLLNWSERAKSRVVFIHFDNLTSRSFDLGSALGEDGLSGIEISIPNSNQGRTLTNKNRELPAVTVADMGRIGLVRKLADFIKEVAPSAFERAKMLSRSMTFRKAGYRRVSPPSERLEDLNRSYEHCLKYLQHRDA